MQRSTDGQAGVLRAPRVAVAVLAVDLVRLDVDVVGKVDGLRRGDGRRRPAAPRGQRREDQDGEQHQAEGTDARLALIDRLRALRG